MARRNRSRAPGGAAVSFLIRVDVDRAAELRRVVLQWSDGGETGHLVPLSAHVIDDDLVERIARRVVELRDQTELFSSRTRGGVSDGRQRRRRSAMLRGAHPSDGVSTGPHGRQVADSATCREKS